MNLRFPDFRGAHGQSTHPDKGLKQRKRSGVTEGNPSGKGDGTASDIVQVSGGQPPKNDFPAGPMRSVGRIRPTPNPQGKTTPGVSLPTPRPGEEEEEPRKLSPAKKAILGVMAALGLLGVVAGAGANENREGARQLLNASSQSTTVPSTPATQKTDTPSGAPALQKAGATSVAEEKTAITEPLPLYKVHLREIGKEDSFPGKIALTFDDGPDPKSTLEILSVLKKNRVRATFFVTGEKAQRFPVIVRKIVAEGHTLGFHGYTGKDLQTLSPEGIKQEIEGGQKAVEKALRRPYPIHHFRPLDAKGFTETVREQATDARKGLISWHVEASDGSPSDARDIARGVVQGVGKEGGVVKLHHSSTVTAKALQEIIKGLKDQGYKFYTVDDLLAQKYGEVDLTPGEINELLEEEAASHGVPKDILKAVAWQETGWKHFDDQGRIMVNINKNEKGSVLSIDWGMMQINDRHHPYAFPGSKESIEYNIEYAARYLKELYKETKDWRLALWSYNGTEEYADSVLRFAKTRPWRHLLAAKQ